MITNEHELKEWLEYERGLYICGGALTEIKLWFLHDSEYLLWHYVKMLRMTEYHCNSNHCFRYFLYQRRKNIEGAKLGISIFHNTIDKGLRIYHYGTIIVNSHAKIGKDCKLHGNNCIGNKGEHNRYEAPTLGDNVDVGIGAKIIGGIEIASNVKIGANAVVVKNELREGKTLVGIPAHMV